ncbi:MAG TPA: hypothetical protein PKA25_04820 [Bradyrhizobium sp.]|nr:hypothetical protein [Bradyrhizobium sp.]
MAAQASDIAGLLFHQLRRYSMNKFRLIVLGAEIVGALTFTFLGSAKPALAKECSSDRPSNARSYWSYRLIDGRKCWYEGKPMLSKSLLHWPKLRSARAAPAQEPNVTPANRYNLLDAQASISSDAAAQPASEARPETVDAGPVSMPERTLTRDHLRVWANSMAAMPAEPVVTILDRWPDKELRQHRTKPAPSEEPSLISTRTILMVGVMFMALVALLFHLTNLHRRTLLEA